MMGWTGPQILPKAYPRNKDEAVELWLCKQKRYLRRESENWLGQGTGIWWPQKAAQQPVPRGWPQPWWLKTDLQEESWRGQSGQPGRPHGSSRPWRWRSSEVQRRELWAWAKQRNRIGTDFLNCKKWNNNNYLKASLWGELTKITRGTTLGVLNKHLTTSWCLINFIFPLLLWELVYWRSASQLSDRTLPGWDIRQGGTGG